MPLTATVAPEANLVPVNVTGTAVPTVPLEGETDVSVGPLPPGFTCSTWLFETVPSLTVMVAFVVVATVKVVIGKVTRSFPAATVTVEGTEAAAGAELFTVRVNAFGAWLVRSISFPFTVLPPVTENCHKFIRESDTGVTVNRAVPIWLPEVAEMVVVLLEVTPLVVIEKGAVVAPAGTVTVAGTEAMFGLELESATVSPPAGAAEVRITRFATVVPYPVIVEGSSVTVRAPADAEEFSTLADNRAAAHVSTHGNSTKFVGTDCDHGAAAVCRWKWR